MMLWSVTRTAMIPNTKGTRVREVNTESFFMDSRTMKRIIIARASTVNIFSYPLYIFYSVKSFPAEVLRLFDDFLPLL